jgi:hypothetical protein
LFKGTTENNTTLEVGAFTFQTCLLSHLQVFDVIIAFGKVKKVFPISLDLIMERESGPAARRSFCCHDGVMRRSGMGTFFGGVMRRDKF